MEQFFRVEPWVPKKLKKKKKIGPWPANPPWLGGSEPLPICHHTWNLPYLTEANVIPCFHACIFSLFFARTYHYVKNRERFKPPFLLKNVRLRKITKWYLLKNFAESIIHKKKTMAIDHRYLTMTLGRRFWLLMTELFD